MRHNARSRTRIVMLLLAFVPVVAALAGTSALRLSVDSKPIEGVTRPVFDAQLGFPIVGRVAKVLVKPGDRVTANQELIRLEDSVPLVQLELLELRANSDLEVEAAKGDWEIAKVQRQLMSEAFKKQGATALEVERAVLEAEKARLAYELFRQRREEAKRQVAEGRERLSQYTLRAPREGAVDRLVTEAGEIVQEQRPVLRLVDVRTLRVEAAVPTDLSLALKPSQTVWVSYPEDNQRMIEAQVISLAAVADAGSNTRIVRVEFANPDDAPAGRAILLWLRRPDAARTHTP